jgi:hypothetical protein
LADSTAVSAFLTQAMSVATRGVGTRSLTVGESEVLLVMTETRVELSVVMPYLNERETVSACVRKAIAALRDAGVSAEAIVTDNGSTEGSVEIAQAEGALITAALESVCVEADDHIEVLIVDAEGAHDAWASTVCKFTGGLF